MSTLRVGIASYERMKERTQAIARGEFKPGPRDPKVWFPSTESLARVLSSKNQELLETIRRSEPKSLTELAVETGRAKSNLSRTIKTMERYGIVVVTHGADGRLAPRVAFDRVEMVMEIGIAGCR